MTPPVYTVLRHAARACCGVIAASAVLAGAAAGQQDNAQEELASVDIRVLLAEHAERIQHLEAMIERLSRAQGAMNGPCGGSGDLATGWRSEAAWDRLSMGMSETVVIAILGRPSRVDTGPAHRTLYYEEAVEGQGLLRGSVRIVEHDQVELIRRPTIEPGS